MIIEAEYISLFPDNVGLFEWIEREFEFIARIHQLAIIYLWACDTINYWQLTESHRSFSKKKFPSKNTFRKWILVYIDRWNEKTFPSKDERVLVRIYPPHTRTHDYERLD